MLALEDFQWVVDLALADVARNRLGIRSDISDHRHQLENLLLNRGEDLSFRGLRVSVESFLFELA